MHGFFRHAYGIGFVPVGQDREDRPKNDVAHISEDGWAHEMGMIHMKGAAGATRGRLGTSSMPALMRRCTFSYRRSPTTGPR
jgi:hypothetical protein